MIIWATITLFQLLLSCVWEIELACVYRNVFSMNLGQRGYAGISDSNEVIFGKRTVKTYENTYTINCMIRNNLGIVFKGRYYWSQGDYSAFYKLNPDGNLGETLTNYSKNHDFTYSVFNIDLGLQWEFAPGSVFVFHIQK